MQEQQNAGYTEYAEPINYVQSILFALIGGLVGVSIWLVPVYFFDYILYITVILVGIFAGLGARGYQRKKGNIALSIIAILATIACIIIGDLTETAIVLGSIDISLESYLDYIGLKFGEDPEQLFYYAGAVLAAAYFGFATLNQD